VRRAAAYERTIQDRGEIPRIILDEDDKDAQEKRLRAELGNSPFVIAHVIVSPSERKEEPLPIVDGFQERKYAAPDAPPQRKVFVEENVARFEAAQTSPAVSAGRSNAGIPLEAVNFGRRQLRARTR